MGARRKDLRPNSVLRDSFGTSTRAVADRVIATWHRASDLQRESGGRWYRLAPLLCGDIGEGDVRFGAAVLAALSPQTPWILNVSFALEYGATGDVESGWVNGQRRTQLQRIEAARLAGSDPVSAIKGRKIRAFAETLAAGWETSDRHVVIDVWALSVAVGRKATEEDQKSLKHVGAYDALQHAYRVAADRLGVSVADLQAVTWLVARDEWESTGRQDVAEDALEALYAGAVA